MDVELQAGDALPQPSPRKRGEADEGESALRIGGGRAGWLLKVVLEVVLISLGVFLALLGDEWRENAQNRELARSSLRGFRAEIVANREAVAAVKDYHARLLPDLRAYLAADPKDRNVPQIQGIRPVFFEQTAWDLAIATEALAHIDQPLAFELSRIYGLQRGYADETRGMMQAVFLKPFVETFDGLTAYYGDLVIWEPQLLKMYEDVLPHIDAALATP